MGQPPWVEKLIQASLMEYLAIASQIVNEGHDKARGLDSMFASEFKSISKGHRAGGAIFPAAQ